MDGDAGAVGGWLVGEGGEQLEDGVGVLFAGGEVGLEVLEVEADGAGVVGGAVGVPAEAEGGGGGGVFELDVDGGAAALTADGLEEDGLLGPGGEDVGAAEFLDPRPRRKPWPLR